MKIKITRRSLLTSLLVMAQIGFTQAYFNDTSGHKYEKAIDYLENQKVIKGYEDNSFKPEQTLNRAEFTKILLTAFYPESTIDLEANREVCFDDLTQTEAWFVPYVCLAKKKGLISGYPDNTFRATNEIQFVEAAKVVALTFDSDLKASSDLWFRPYVAELLSQKVVPTNDIEGFDQTLTRGQMAEVVARSLKAQSQTLDGYLSYRETRYNENQFPSWESFYTHLDTSNQVVTTPAEVKVEVEVAVKPKTVEPVEPTDNGAAALKAALTAQAIATTEHPGPYVDSNYIANYQQWTLAGYPASLENDYLSDGEKEIMRAQLFRLFNEKRAEWDKPLVVFDEKLNLIAQEHAEHLVTNGIYSHTNIAGEDPFDRARRVGYTGFVTESLTWRKKDAEAALAWWEQSALHWNNMMNSKYTNVGIGIAGEKGDRILFNVMTGE